MWPFPEHMANAWLPMLWRASLHGGIAILIVSAVASVAGRWFRFPAWGEHWLWRVVYLKMLLALVVVQAIPLPILPPQVRSDSEGDRVAIRSQSRPDASFGQESMMVEPGGVPGLPGSLKNQHSETKTAFATLTRMTGLPWPSLLWIAWMIGASLTLLTLVRQFLEAQRLPLEPVTTPWLISECERLSTAYQLHSVPSLAVSDHVHGPLLVGLFRPTIVFSPDVLSQCSRDQLRVVLAHELAHVRRSDLWWNLLPAVVRVFFFFHPLVWLANHRWHVSREVACDGMAINRSRESVARYADGLLQVAVLGTQRYRLANALGRVAAFSSTRSLRQRIMEMKKDAVCSPRRTILWAGCIVLSGLLGLVPWTLVSRAAEPNSAAVGKNMDFEEQSDDGIATSWSGGGQGYDLRLDSSKPHSGKSCALITSQTEERFGTYTQCIDARGLIGKRIAFRGFLRSDSEGNGGLWMRIDADDEAVEFDNMADRRVTGRTDWARQEVVLDVPEKATKICFGFLLTGKGSLWADDLTIEVVEKTGRETTGIEFDRATTLVNGGFDEAMKSDASKPKSWGGGGSGYELSRDSETKHSGAASGRIEKTGDQGKFATHTQMFPAKEFLGKRVRYTGWLKTKDAEASGLWMRVDGPGGKLLGFDNMQTRSVKGTTDWTEYTVVLDVPTAATHIALGFLSIGEGTVWGDDLRLDVVGSAGEGPPTTGVEVKPAEMRAFVNGSFDEASPTSQALPKGWGGGGKGYRLVRDEATRHAGQASAKIEKVGGGSFGTFTQMFSAKDFRGKRLSYTGMLKTDNAESAGLWMRIDGPGNRVLGFDNMQTRPVKGTTDWTEYSIELDVPEEATHIALGFLLAGNGAVWADDLKLQVVSAD